jgi:hypothetical protein
LLPPVGSRPERASIGSGRQLNDAKAAPPILEGRESSVTRLVRAQAEALVAVERGVKPSASKFENGGFKNLVGLDNGRAEA